MFSKLPSSSELIKGMILVFESLGSPSKTPGRSMINKLNLGLKALAKYFISTSPLSMLIPCSTSLVTSPKVIGVLPFTNILSNSSLEKFVISSDPLVNIFSEGIIVSVSTPLSFKIPQKISLSSLTFLLAIPIPSSCCSPSINPSDKLYFLAAG